MVKPVNKTLRIAAMSAGEEIGHVSGPVVTFRGNGDPLRSLLVNIDPVQEGTGDPSPDNVRPISGWSEAKVTRTGKNLCDSAVGRYVWASGVRYDNTTGAYCATENKFEIVGGQGYIVRFVNTATTQSVSMSFFAGDTYISAQSKYAEPYVFDAPNTATKAAIAIRNSKDYTGSPTVSNLQLELGSTATAYAPYSGNQYTIQLGQTVYGATLDVTNGVLTVDRAMVDLGTLSWIYRSNLGGMSAGLTPTAKDRFNAICSMYLYNGPYSDLSDKQCGYVYNTHAFVKDSRYTDAATFKTAMNGVQLCYELATPITIPLTPQEISTLPNTTIWADTGDSDVEYIATGGEGGKLALLLRNRKELLIALRKGLTPAEAGLLNSTPLLGGFVRPGLSTDDEKEEDELW